MILASLSGVVPFIIYFVGALAAMLVFMWVYTRITPHDENALIRDNNQAAAISYVGAVLGMALAVSAAVANSVGLVDFAVWVVVAGLAQISAFFGLRLLYPKLSERIEAGECAAAIKLAGISVMVGLLNAASMTY
ncbi:MAG: DUF350 domain-containing protein [Paracoccaceae bacterium]